MQTFDSDTRLDDARSTDHATLIDLIGDQDDRIEWLEPDASVHSTVEQIDESQPTEDRSTAEWCLDAVRVSTVSKVSLVFFGVLFVSLVATGVVVWNLVRALGVVGGFEELMTTSLGLESFEIAGGQLLAVFAALAATISVMGFALTVLTVVVYNAVSRIFGGLSLELRRDRATTS